ncbi:TIGR03943 family putative permease subunit [Desulfoferula mesophila]|uniref:DUF1980 domain-containing protein n=1 Tax=Desulfoferula mesophila TaxID=3058419 RepID=A0AAU9EWM3_9BACT|nr:hypothetical protein FAK_02980 [Desulfoferula mesophilus]
MVVVRPNRLFASLEALILAGLGLFMLTLSFSQDYWMLLNPKFRWLTGGAGGLLTLCGLVAALATGRRSGPLKTLVLAALLVVCLAWDQGAFSQPGVSPGAAPFTRSQQERIASRVSRGGHEYVKINLAELFVVAEEGDQAKLDQRYVLRAQVVDTPNLKSQGRFALVRLSVYCCLADAVWVGFLAAPADGVFPPMGSWVSVYGRLEPRPNAPQKSEAQLDSRTNRVSAINQRYYFQADKVVPLEPPAVPYMFEIRQQEPYAY